MLPNSASIYNVCITTFFIKKTYSLLLMEISVRHDFSTFTLMSAMLVKNRKRKREGGNKGKKEKREKEKNERNKLNM